MKNKTTALFTEQELVYLAALLGEETLRFVSYRPPDDAAVLHSDLHRCKYEMIEKGLLDEDFAGNLQIDQQIAEVVRICARADCACLIQLEQADDEETMTAILYRCDGRWMQRIREGHKTTLVQFYPDIREPLAKWCALLPVDERAEPHEDCDLATVLAHCGDEYFTLTVRISYRDTDVEECGLCVISSTRAFWISGIPAETSQCSPISGKSLYAWVLQATEVR